MPTSTNPNRNIKHPGVFEYTTPEAAETEFHMRLIASAADLPKLCTIKNCRRRQRCLGPFDGDLPCRRRHLGLFHERFQSALKRLGWSMSDP